MILELELARRSGHGQWESMEQQLWKSMNSQSHMMKLHLKPQQIHLNIYYRSPNDENQSCLNLLNFFKFCIAKLINDIAKYFTPALPSCNWCLIHIINEQYQNKELLNNLIHTRFCRRTKVFENSVLYMIWFC